MDSLDLIVVGAGAAGCFASIVLGELSPEAKIAIIEKTRQPLAKVKISGGGRCNVTHHCFDPKQLVSNYPRGRDFLLGPFSYFQPSDMVAWLGSHGVDFVTEPDGRMFPSTHSSQTIINCFLEALEKQNTPLLLEKEVIDIEPISPGWKVVCKDGSHLISSQILICTGGSTKMYPLLEKLGHTVEPPIPSLFTFSLKEDWIKSLSGSSVSLARVSIEGTSFSCVGPMLITHWGMSGPAILRLSAFAARWLFSEGYKATLLVNWAKGLSEQKVREGLLQIKQSSFSKQVVSTPVFSLTKNLWKALYLHTLPQKETLSWGAIKQGEIDLLVKALCRMPFSIEGKSINKEEFVTSGGVSLREIQPKTMESKRWPGLYFAGEVMDIDGVTGGFNIQNAWTSATLAARAVAEKIERR